MLEMSAIYLWEDILIPLECDFALQVYTSYDITTSKMHTSLSVSCDILTNQPCLNGGQCQNDGSCDCTTTGSTGVRCETSKF